MQFAEFQQFIRDRYHETDAARGVPGPFCGSARRWGNWPKPSVGGNVGMETRRISREEFADVLAWLTTLANICEVDLEAAVREKYFKNGGPTGTK